MKRHDFPRPRIAFDRLADATHEPRAGHVSAHANPHRRGDHFHDVRDERHEVRRTLHDATRDPNAETDI